MGSITGNFKKFFDGVQNEIDRKYTRPKREIVIMGALFALKTLQTMRPVDTGRYRAGHTLSINVIPLKAPTPPSPGTQRSRSALKQKGASVGPVPKYSTEAQANMIKATATLKGLNWDKVSRLSIYITNNVEYGPFIEAGIYTKDPNAPKALYAKTREKVEEKMNMAIRAIR